jgi:hypothetical protein
VLLEPIETADQRRLARARRPADHDALAAPDRELDAAQRLEGAEPFAETIDLDDGLGIGREIVDECFHEVQTRRSRLRWRSSHWL